MTSAPSTITESGTSKFVRIQEGDLDLQLHYNDAGQGAETVVMLHGSGPGASGWANFNRNVEPFVNAGYRVVLMDCPGWSKSDPIVNTGSRSELNARALKGLMDAIGLDKVHIVGNSMGAHSTVAFALAHPTRVGKLILMGGGTGGPSQFVPMPTEGIKLIGALYRDPTIENLKRMMNVFVYDTSHLTDALFQARLDNMLARRDHLENFVKSSTGQPQAVPRSGPPPRRNLGRHAGDLGARRPLRSHGCGLAPDLGHPQRTAARVQPCGHWAQWEHAEKFNRLVLDFLTH